MLTEPRKELKKFCCVGTALYTPYDAKGELIIEGVNALVEFNLKHGIGLFFVGGSTGEGLLLNTDERKALTEAVVRRVAGRAAVMVHVGCLATRDAVELAEHAEKAGADAVSSVPPIYYAVPDEAVRNHYLAIAESVSLPVFIYHIPALVSHKLSPSFVEECRKQPNIAGMKFSDNDMCLMREIMVACGPDFIALTGNDQMMMPGLIMGSHGAVGRNQNLMPNLFVKAFQAYRDGNLVESERAFGRLLRFFTILRRYNTSLAGKPVLRMLGLPVGHPRPPLAELSPEVEQQLRVELEEAGFFDAVQA